MLAQVLKVEELSKGQFAKLMYAIVSAIDDSKNYMLHETGFVLKDNFIFIGSDWSDVFLTYVPMEQSIEEWHVHNALQDLMRQISSKLNDRTRKDLDAWLDTDTLSSTQSLQDFKINLLKLMDQRTPVQEGLPKPIWKQNTINQPLNKTSLVKESPFDIPLLDVKQDLGTTPTVAFTPITQRSQMIVLIGVILVVAFIWQQYVSSPTTSLLHLSAGTSILLADIWFVLKFLGLPRYKGIGRSNCRLFPIQQRSILKIRERHLRYPKSNLRTFKVIIKTYICIQH